MTSSLAQPISETLAAGVQFKVLAHVFPVLRHEVIAPVSNAGLAVAMLRHGMHGTDSHQEGLINELESMLLESTAEVRRLGDWLEGTGATLPLDHLLELCRKLLFGHLLRAARQIDLPESCPVLDLPEFGSRYVLLAWFLSLLDHLPHDDVLHIEMGGERHLVARPSTPRGFAVPPATPGRIAMDEVQCLAEHHGWQCRFDDQSWSLKLPSGTVLPG
ncbi:MAG TPA: hypothetical protein VGC69_14450 [Bordetella sp.]